MKIVKAEAGHSDIIGRVHSEAWKQAYKDIFPDEYLEKDTTESRTQEFLDSCKDKDIWYYMICEDTNAVGIVKLINDVDKCEISSLYILNEYRNRGYGRQVVEYMRKELYPKTLMLWVLKDNVNAIRFYENNGFVNTGNTRVIQRGNQYMQMQYELTVFGDTEGKE